MFKGLLFDLDGVIVDTAKYHFLAWKSLAEELGISFTLQDNERLKGVSRMASFDIILEIGGYTMDQAKKEECCAKKNEIYVDYIKKLERNEILPGVENFLKDARSKDYKIALGSASRNSMLILERLGIVGLFDSIIDGTKVSKAKPDPEVFIRGAESLGLDCNQCIVFEDAIAGVKAAHNGGMKVVGIGSPDVLTEADSTMPGFEGVTIDDVVARLN